MSSSRTRGLLCSTVLAGVSLLSVLACTDSNASRSAQTATAPAGSPAAHAAASNAATAGAGQVNAAPTTAMASASAHVASSGTAAIGAGQAGSVLAGEQVYTQNCAICHGSALDGSGGRFPPLLGRQTVPDFPSTTVLFDYISRSMPYGNPGTLTADQYYSVIAYLLNKNDILPADGLVNKETLPTIKLPGADPIGPPLPGAPSQQQTVSKGSSADSPVTP
jgi:mono/diheme cytochrome c family protein